MLLPKNSPKSVIALVEDTKALAAEHGIEIYFGKGAAINYGNGQPRVSGTFDGKKLCVATGTEGWIATFVHESCHMDQYIEDSKYWRNMSAADYGKVERYLSGQDVRDVEFAFDNIVMCEADCERRTADKVMKYGLPLKLENLNRRANAYLFSHKAMYEKQMWVRRAPAEFKSIWQRMPETVYLPSEYRMGSVEINTSIFDKCF